MKRFFKYGVVPVVTFLFLLIATVVVFPVVVNVQKYLPEIEKKLSETAGRQVTIGSDFALSFFPWLSVSFSDLKIGNPDGYLSSEFLKVESFEARIKLLPLLKKELEVSRFIMGGLEVNLEKKTDGMVNWDFSQAGQRGAPIPSLDSIAKDWTLVDDLSIALFVVTDGTVTWVDRIKDSRRQVEDLMLLLNNVTLDEPVAMEYQGTIEGVSLSAEGTVGPLGRNPGKGELPVDLAVRILENLSGYMEGTLINLLENPEYELSLKISPFSAKELLTSLEIGSPPAYIAWDSLRSVSFDVAVKGDGEKLSIGEGKLNLDDTSADFSLGVTFFDQPQYQFTLNMDRLDLDHYMIGAEKNEEQLSSDVSEADDYSAWKKIDLSGTVQLKELAVAGGTVNDIKTELRVADGILNMNPWSFILYQGEGQGILTVDFQRPIPQTTIDFKAQGVQAKPFFHDFWMKDFLSGTLDADLRLVYSGFRGEAIKSSLYADGTLICKDGVMWGIDMVDALSNIKDSADEPDPSDQVIRTDFSELKSIISVRDGLAAIKDTTLKAPMANVAISGFANLIQNELKLMVEPKSLAVGTKEEENELETLKGSIPFSLSGSFAEPSISIDAQYMSLEGVKLPKELDLQSYVDGKLPSPDDDDVKDLVGRTLIDADVVARRFGLKRELISKSREKKQFKVGSGKIVVGPLEEQDSLR